MKVLHIIDSGGLYGAERVLLALMSALRDDGLGCSLASIAEPGVPEKALEAEARRLGFDVRRRTMEVGPDRRAARGLAAEARTEGFNLIHTHGYKANTLIAGIPRAHRGLPVVATLHGWTATRRFSRMGAYEALERLALRRADGVTAVSQAMIDRWSLDRRYGDRLHLIPNGIAARAPLSPTAGQLPAEIAAFIAGRPAIFAAGRLSAEKGFDVLITALAMIRAKGVEARLVLAGQGGQRAALRQQACELQVDNAVMMPGYLENAGNLISNFNVVAIPSRSEGLPVVLLEALLSRVPVVATSVGDMPAVLASCGAKPAIRPEDPDGLARALEAALSSPCECSVLEEQARKAAEHYSAQAMASRYRALYAALGQA